MRRKGAFISMLLITYDMSDIITRRFVIKRDDRELISDFKTLSDIFENPIKGYSENHQKTVSFFHKVFTEGYPDRSGKTSVSDCPELIVEKTKLTEHPIIDCAKEVNWKGFGSRQHQIVEDHCIQNSIFTFACELPVWNDNTHGHIDIVDLLEDDCIGLWDFKPNACKETHAASQCWNYKVLFCRITGVCPSKVMTGYFDDEALFLVNN